jgi:hypothetical protein
MNNLLGVGQLATFQQAAAAAAATTAYFPLPLPLQLTSWFPTVVM